MQAYRALILCDGEPPSNLLFQSHYEACDLCIATDGAAYAALNFGITPDVVIGDMDSFVPPENYQGKIVTEAEQDSNDLEKALKHAKAMKADHVVVLGATGKRLDHTLKNLSVYKKFSTRFLSLGFEDDYVKIILLPKKFSGKVSKGGTTISLFPLSGKVKGIVTTGLKYQLNYEDLENGIRDGSSNETVGNYYEIEHREGDLLLFVPQQHEGTKFKEKNK
ncbi:MAG: thiamine diphosphokinase [Balneolales bacterium]